MSDTPVVSLREVRRDTVLAICAPSRRGFVAPNAVSIARAHVAPVHRGLGFTPTGQVDDGQVVLRLPLA